jgi:leucine-rich repeat protein SHOC2
MCHNRLKSLPESVGNLPKLSALYAASNELSELANAVRNLSRLNLLDVSSNQLDQLPDFVVAEMPDLCDIDVSFNKLLALPESWGSKYCEFSGDLIV